MGYCSLDRKKLPKKERKILMKKLPFSILGYSKFKTVSKYIDMDLDLEFLRTDFKNCSSGGCSLLPYVSS